MSIRRVAHRHRDRAALAHARTLREREPSSHSRVCPEHLLGEWEEGMPRGDKSKYTEKQQRKAEHIERGYESRGVSEKEAERRAWATVDKDDGCGKRVGGSGRGKSTSHPAARKGRRIGTVWPSDLGKPGLRRQKKPRRPDGAMPPTGQTDLEEAMADRDLRSSLALQTRSLP